MSVIQCDCGKTFDEDRAEVVIDNCIICGRIRGSVCPDCKEVVDYTHNHTLDIQQWGSD
jgi:hypothetical protein